jgi:protein-S-isoprenylcysteine O-methyltransferase Ste14
MNTRALVFVWPYALGFWIVYFWAFAPEFIIIARSGKSARASGSKDSGSLGVILMGIWIAMFLAFPLSAIRSLRFPPEANLIAFCIGTGMLIAGSLLRRHCWRVLGEYFTGDVQARADQPVIDRGAYRWVRHPSYAGGILMFAGIGVALGSWASAVILVVASVAVYSYRIKIEEKALVASIGEPYVAFMRTRKRLIPFVV